MDALNEPIERKRAELNGRWPTLSGSLARLQKYFDIELTYTSNALAGNALTLRETAEVIEQGTAVGGKLLDHHIQAVDHYDAIWKMRELAASAAAISDEMVRELHARIVARSRPAIAGVYRTEPRPATGGSSSLPDGADVPRRMKDFEGWLAEAERTPAASFEALLRMSAIAPFSEGNGRAARLLMNLLLVRGGYPPVAIPDEDRDSYRTMLDRGVVRGDPASFQTFMHERLDAALDAYLGLLRD
jgi:Fic family protein